MKRFLLALLLVTGCASFRGIVSYDGPLAPYPQVRVIVYRYPEPGIWGGMWRWRADPRLIVDNPSSYPWTVDVDCDGWTMYRDIDLAPRTSRYFILGREDVHCTVSWR